MSEKQETHDQLILRAKLRVFAMPPIHDCLVLGVLSPIGCNAMRRCVDLLMADPFEHIEVEDEVISNVIVRRSILRRVPKEKLLNFVMKRVKPLMTAEEILHLDLETEIMVEESLL